MMTITTFGIGLLTFLLSLMQLSVMFSIEFGIVDEWTLWQWLSREGWAITTNCDPRYIYAYVVEYCFHHYCSYRGLRYHYLLLKKKLQWAILDCTSSSGSGRLIWSRMYHHPGHAIYKPENPKFNCNTN